MYLKYKIGNQCRKYQVLTFCKTVNFFLTFSKIYLGNFGVAVFHFYWLSVFGSEHTALL